MAQSKNSKKGSKSTMMMPTKKEKPKKTEIKIELTKKVFDRFCETKDVSEYIDENGKSRKVLNIQKFYGKTYLVCSND